MEETKKKYDSEETKEGHVRTDETGHKFLNQYELISKIGQGSYAKVKLCRLDQTFYAAKVFQKSILNKKLNFIELSDGEVKVVTGYSDLIREIAIMKKLTHKNVVKLIDVIYDETTDKLYMIMDYCSKGSLMEWNEDTGRFYFPWTQDFVDESTTRKIFRDLVCGLEYLHYHNIAHRDIKPQNILLTEDWVSKLADFGQSHLLDDKDMNQRSLGTYNFYPPESCNQDQSCDPKPGDIWALGLTFYVFLYNKMPFEGESMTEIFEKINSFELTFPETTDPDLRFLIERMLDKSPETRIHILEILRNPWLNRDLVLLSGTEGNKIIPSQDEIESSIKAFKTPALAVICI
jgi:calcium/calmodulin-dependent protein kinase kinase 2